MAERAWMGASAAVYASCKHINIIIVADVRVFPESFPKSPSASIGWMFILGGRTGPELIYAAGQHHSFQAWMSTEANSRRK